MSAYGEDLAAVHAAGFTGLAAAAARELLPRLPGAPALVVDLGCGDGTTAALLTAAGHEVLGIDASAALIALARRSAPRAAFRVASFVDAELPPGCDAILGIGEVLGYALDPRADLDRALERAARALRPGGLLLFDLAGPGRVGPGGECAWTAGDGWAALAESRPRGDAIERRIVTFRTAADGRRRRAEELHRLVLHRPAEVLARLRARGLTGAVLAAGYAGTPLPRGLTAYLATPAPGAAAHLAVRGAAVGSSVL